MSRAGSQCSPVLVRGEPFVLRADDIDISDETLLIVRTGSNRHGQTKTHGSKRTIDLPPLAAQLLREWLLARSLIG